MSKPPPTESTAPETRLDLADHIGRFFARHRLLKIWLIFAGIIALTAAFHQWATYWVNVWLAEVTAEMAAFTLRMLGEEAKTNGTMLLASPCTFEIIGECTAYYPIGVFIAAVMAYPCKLRPKLIGVALGVPALLVINLVRLITLCYAYSWFREAFETLHLVVWQSLIMILTFFLWMVWASVLARHHVE